MHKRSIQNQIYEEYWKLTLENTDYLGRAFNEVLKTIADFIDENVNAEIGITSEQYKTLQIKIGEKFRKSNSASTRKSINQFFKLGFINNGGKSYHALTRQFLQSGDPEEKRLIYSKILYSNASFSRSYSNPAEINEIKFLIKTLENCESLDKNDLLALIYTDIGEVEKGYLTKEELHVKYLELEASGAPARKYNQCGYLYNLCKSLTGVNASNNFVWICAAPETEKEEKSKTRDPYLQRLYKIELINEYKSLYGAAEGACVLEKLAYPILIASHIKPYIKCAPDEEFDRDNGLLLSKNMDSLFDNGYITFEDNGTIKTSSKLNPGVASYVTRFSLDSIILTAKRKVYLDYHRKFVFKP